jgi:hypothetical protein
MIEPKKDASPKEETLISAPSNNLAVKGAWTASLRFVVEVEVFGGKEAVVACGYRNKPHMSVMR